jgi:hypothetical protein
MKSILVSRQLIAFSSKVLHLSNHVNIKQMIPIRWMFTANERNTSIEYSCLFLYYQICNDYLFIDIYKYIQKKKPRHIKSELNSVIQQLFIIYTTFGK